MTTNHVNGDVATPRVKSAFLQHLLRYPVINDGVASFKQNEYGQRSLRLSDSAYRTLGAPVVSLLARPYQYVSPYVKAADDLGDATLSRVDERFPAVRKPSRELYAEAKGLVLLPYHKGIEGRDHLVQLYAAEYKKHADATTANANGSASANGNAGNGLGDVGGDLVVQAKSALSTLLIVGNETLAWVGSFLGAKKEEAKEAMDEKAKN